VDGEGVAARHITDHEVNPGFLQVGYEMQVTGETAELAYQQLSADQLRVLYGFLKYRPIIPLAAFGFDVELYQFPTIRCYEIGYHLLLCFQAQTAGLLLFS
jgi:hypothetical protein